jgi:hypothetical protein
LKECLQGGREWAHDKAVAYLKKRLIYDRNCTIVGYTQPYQVPLLARVRKLQKEVFFPMEDCEAYQLIKAVLSTSKLSGRCGPKEWPKHLRIFLTSQNEPTAKAFVEWDRVKAAAHMSVRRSEGCEEIPHVATRIRKRGSYPQPATA